VALGPLGCDFHDAAAAAAAYFVLQSTVLVGRLAAAVLLQAAIPIRLIVFVAAVGCPKMALTACRT
jgi:hypothetical protein